MPLGAFRGASIPTGLKARLSVRYAVANITAVGFEHMKSMFCSRLKERGYPPFVLDG